MLQSVKVASMKVVGDSRSDVEAKVGARILKIGNIKLLSPDVNFSCSVAWVDKPKSASFEAQISVYYNYDCSIVEKQHCQICRETHDLFYCNRQYNCNQCEYAAYKSRLEEKEKNMRSGGRFVLSGL